MRLGASLTANGNQTNSVVWRRVNGAWEGATNTYYLDAQNRVVETVDPYGYTNSAVYGPSGRQEASIDKLGRVIQYDFDAQGRQYRTIYPDLSSGSSAFDAEGRVRFSTNQLGRVTEYRFDALGRQTNVIYPDLAQSSTLYDGLGRVRFSVDARALTNAFGYDRANRRVAVTNALGTTEQAWSTYAFDPNGNQICVTNVAGVLATNYFDALNRLTNVSFVDGTKVFTVFDGAGRRVAETNQDNIVTLFGYDGLGRLLCVTNALGTTNEMVTRYTFDEAGNQTAQIDALLRTNRFGYNLLSQRVWHSQPGGQIEWFAYDAAGSLVRHTNFNTIVITNDYDLMNRLTNVASVDGYAVGFTYTGTGQRQTMSDPSGATTYEYDERDRLLLKKVLWTDGPEISLHYAYNSNGNVTNIWSSTVNGVNLRYEHDCLNRITNVLANGSLAASYGFDFNGNLRSLRYGNGVTNLWQYDVLNRLTNAVWKSNALTLASFYYQLGKTGNRTNLTETLLTSVTNRTYSWTYDPLYRLRTEAISGLGNTSYGLDSVGNRTHRAPGLDSLPEQSFSYTSNDWVETDAYDSNGSTLWSTNGGTATGPYYYDVENRLTNFNNSVYFAYNGDGLRVEKTVAGTTTYYLLDDRNPTGYAQVLEEWSASAGTANLNRVYNYGLALISQREAASTNYFIVDGHGSTRLLANNAGDVVNAFAFDAYGNLITSNAPPQTWFLYCCEEFDPHLVTYNLRARYYQPQTGRFWTMDPAEGNQEDPLSLHKYLYCKGDPINLTDPSGRHADRPCELTLWINFNSGFGDFTFISGMWAHGDVVVNVSRGENLFESFKHTMQVNGWWEHPGLKFKRITISGHGSPGDLGFSQSGEEGNITLESLNDSGSPQSQLFGYLKPLMTSSAKVHLDACNMANDDVNGKKVGRMFMQRMATLVGANVIGYDDLYAIWGRGNEWTAYPNKKPDGTEVVITKQGAPYIGSVTYKLHHLPTTIGDLLGSFGGGWLGFP